MAAESGKQKLKEAVKGSSALPGAANSLATLATDNAKGEAADYRDPAGAVCCCGWRGLHMLCCDAARGRARAHQFMSCALFVLLLCLQVPCSRTMCLVSDWGCLRPRGEGGGLPHVHAMHFPCSWSAGTLAHQLLLLLPAVRPCHCACACCPAGSDAPSKVKSAAKGARCATRAALERSTSLKASLLSGPGVRPLADTLNAFRCGVDRDTACAVSATASADRAAHCTRAAKHHLLWPATLQPPTGVVNKAKAGGGGGLSIGNPAKDLKRAATNLGGAATNAIPGAGDSTSSASGTGNARLSAPLVRDSIGQLRPQAVNNTGAAGGGQKG
jgi:hypothetical protein